MNWHFIMFWNVMTTCFLLMVLIDITEDFSPAMIACDEDWSIGKPWMLSLTAESLDKEDREFGFAGGEGFLVSWVQWEWRGWRNLASTPIPPNLEIHCMIPCKSKQYRFQVALKLWFPKVFKVPKASVGIKITVAGNVQTLADHARLEYRGSDPITVQNAVKLSNICLRLLALKNYEECNEPRWGKKVRWMLKVSCRCFFKSRVVTLPLALVEIGNSHRLRLNHGSTMAPIFGQDPWPVITSLPSIPPCAKMTSGSRKSIQKRSRDTPGEEENWRHPKVV